IAPSSFLLPDLNVSPLRPDLSLIVPIIAVRKVNQEPVFCTTPLILFRSPSRIKVFPDRASSTVHSRYALYFPALSTCTSQCASSSVLNQPNAFHSGIYWILGPTLSASAAHNTYRLSA